MNRKTLELLNYGLLGLTGFFVVLALLFQLLKAVEVPVSDVKPAARPLPKNRFALSPDAYLEINDEFLSLNSSPPTIQVPDLSRELNYYGPNGRPDLGNGYPVLQFGLARSRDSASIPSSDKLYLRYDKDGKPPGYIFSPENQETALWIEVEPKEDEALIKVRIADPDGNIIADPIENAEITLKEKPFNRSSVRKDWKISTFKVDGTLLARQRAKWYGEDLFLMKHGGDEYADLANKLRIDFGQNEKLYSLYLGEGGVAVWENEKWENAEPGPETVGKPLLQLNKIDDRLLKFNLWDETGKHKISLNLLKAREPWVPNRLEKDFKFISSRTRSQYVFEVQKKRMTLRPFDWLIQKNGSWKKLNTEKEIDDYVDGKLSGVLFIFDGNIETEDGTVLQGTLFNKSRTASHAFEITEDGKEKRATPVKPKTNTPKPPNFPPPPPSPPPPPPPSINPRSRPFNMENYDPEDFKSMNKMRWRENFNR